VASWPLAARAQPTAKVWRIGVLETVSAASNDANFDALWFARGGYGSARLASRVLAGLNDVARHKTYLGYSDAGSLLAALYTRGFQNLAHGPMAADLTRDGGEQAVTRALAYLVDRAPDTLEPSVSPDRPSAAFNIMILSHLIGTPLQPDLSGHVLMLEEVGEYMYRVDRSLQHIVSNADVRRAAGIRLGRWSPIPPNDPNFGQTEEDVIKHWCAVSGIPYLGRADIGPRHPQQDRAVWPFSALFSPHNVSKTSSKGPLLAAVAPE
jgi:muramoyltetrapeptide carboxypeptidase